MKFSRGIAFLGLLLVMTGSVLCLDGCKAKEQKKHNRTIQGTVEEIDIPGNTVTMNWFNEKQGKSLTLAGKITKETEVYIDGKLADLSQVKTGDKVIVEGYKKGTDIVAIKVSITHGSQTPKASRATTQPVK